MLCVFRETAEVGFLGWVLVLDSSVSKRRIMRWGLSEVIVPMRRWSWRRCPTVAKFQLSSDVTLTLLVGH